jgi:cytochrome P450
MTALADSPSSQKPSAAAESASAANLEPRYAPSPAHQVDEDVPINLPIGPTGSTLQQTIAFARDPYGYGLENQGRFGDVYAMKLMTRKETMLASSHPDHIRSVFTASPADMPSLTGDSPLRPIVGPYSVLTLVGPEHLRQRKLLLPPFHGDAVDRYVKMIEEVTAKEIDSWKPASTFPLAPRMQAVTLDIIMKGVLGIEQKGSWATPQRRFREAIRFFLNASNNSAFQVAEMMTARRREPSGLLKLFVSTIDRELYPLIKARRAQETSAEAHDVFSLLLAARDEDGNTMSDHELRDELLTLILAGHETTANSLAWTFERLVRNEGPYTRLRELVRGDDQQAADAYVEATVHEGMRVRPVISFVVRMAEKPWRFGEYVVPKKTPVALSITGVHHREDVYADAHAFKPERWIGEDGTFQKPGTYTWIPFGGGIRRCLGATLAMAEQRIVLKQIAERVDLQISDAPAERPRQRNVTSIPADGGIVTVANRR